MEKVKCNKCKVNLPITHFKVKRSGDLTKQCIKCLEYAENQRKCACGKRRTTCVIHGGSAMCECGKRKSRCMIHGGSAMCECGKQRADCKVCNDPIKVTIKSMIKNSRFSDKKYDRFDVYHFIDTDFLRGLIEDQPNCYWSDCNTPLQYITYTDNLTTIERLNNSIGHIKSNCVLACKSCNCKRKSNH
jgi:hypothetical protein